MDRRAPVKPPKLKPGDTICLVAPGSSVSNPASLARGRRFLEELGYKTVEGLHVHSKNLLFAGEDAERADDINRAFADPSIKAIFCSQGGAGSARMLPFIDFRVVRRNPKIFLGYSDVTALQIAMFRKSGLVSFYGPMVATDLGRRGSFDAQSFFAALTTCEGRVEAVSTHTTRASTLYPGEAEGALLGGCLSVLVSTVGSAWEIDTTDKILFFEDIDEQPHRVDRYLTQLALAGKLQSARALVFGGFTRCEYDVRRTGAPPVRTIDIARDWAHRLKKPCVWGIRFGHVRNKLTLPNGGFAFLDANNRRLIFEAAVRSS